MWSEGWTHLSYYHVMIQNASDISSSTDNLSDLLWFILTSHMQSDEHNCTEMCNWIGPIVVNTGLQKSRANVGLHWSTQTWWADRSSKSLVLLCLLQFLCCPGWDPKAQVRSGSSEDLIMSSRKKTRGTWEMTLPQRVWNVWESWPSDPLFFVSTCGCVKRTFCEDGHIYCWYHILLPYHLDWAEAFELSDILRSSRGRPPTAPSGPAAASSTAVASRTSAATPRRATGVSGNCTAGWKSHYQHIIFYMKSMVLMICNSRIFTFNSNSCMKYEHKSFHIDNQKNMQIPPYVHMHNYQTDYFLCNHTPISIPQCTCNADRHGHDACAYTLRHDFMHTCTHMQNTVKKNI